ncbi:MAG: hypothetical protein LBD25_01550 [Coriobacteriales bacterium]|nr:hypothetical protein [Coriobacteriales bacterium]
MGLVRRGEDGSFLELRKLVQSHDLILEEGFDQLCAKLLNSLRVQPDEERVERIVRNELIVTYGLYSDEFDSKALAREIMSWWERN